MGYSKEAVLEDAIKASKTYQGRIDDSAYWVLMEYARSNTADGARARNALADAKKNDCLGSVNSRAYDEDTYASLGTPTT